MFKSSITGKAIERASIAELEQFLEREYPDLDVAAALADTAAQVDRFQLYESLLLPLENVKEPLKYHPEGDALYHSLQVFDLARNELAYDEEFLSAALLHDVGKAIDPANHVAAALEALDGFITERTAWLIEHHMLAHATGGRHARRPRPPPAARIGALRRPGAARRMRPRRPRAGRRSAGAGRGTRLSARAGDDVRLDHHSLLARGIVYLR